MALTEIQGSHVGFYTRAYGSTDVFKRLVCEDTLTFDLANAVTSTLTKCGYFKGVSVPDFKANGTAVNNTTPGAAELSYDDVFGYQTTIQKLEFVIQNEAYGTVGEGAEIRLSGAGYFTNSQGSASANDVVKFTWAFEGVGVPDNTES